MNILMLIRCFQGPKSWSDHYPMCAGFSQSPVNLRTDNAWQDRWNSPLTFTNFDKDDGVSWNLINNGHTGQPTVWVCVCVLSLIHI